MMLGFKERDFPSFWGCRKNMKQRTLQWCYAFCVKKHRQKGILFQHIELTWSVSLSELLLQQILSFFFFFFLVLPVYCYQPVTLHPHAHMLSHVTPWTAACQAPLSMDFSRQEYWSGLPFPSPDFVFFNASFSLDSSRLRKLEAVSSKGRFCLAEFQAIFWNTFICCFL